MINKNSGIFIKKNFFFNLNFTFIKSLRFVFPDEMYINLEGIQKDQWKQEKNDLSENNYHTLVLSWNECRAKQGKYGNFIWKKTLIRVKAFAY